MNSSSPWKHHAHCAAWTGLKTAAGITLALPLATSLASAQPDYGAAHYVPMTNCAKWWDNASDAVAYYASRWGQSGPGGHYFCVIHDMEGYYWPTISYLNNCSVSASIHYMVNGLQNGYDGLHTPEYNPSDPPAGDMTQSVRESYYAWHVVCWNPYMLGTEHEGYVDTPVWYSEAMYEASAGLQRHLCDTWGIPKDRNHIIGHNEWQNSAWTSWMHTNFPNINTTCNTHTDPGIYWNWAHFMTLITNAVGGSYWDMNIAAPGTGSSPSGTWDTTSLNWSTNPVGTSLTGTWPGGSAIFAAGSDAVGPYTITVSGTQTVTNLWVKNGSVIFTGGGLNFTGTGAFYSNAIAAGCTAVFNTPFSGTGSPDKWGTGAAIYNAASTSGGFFSLNEGLLGLGNDAALGTASLRLGDPSGVNFVTLQSADATPHTLPNDLVLNANSFSFGAGGNLAFTGFVDVGANTSAAKSIAVSNSVTTFSGVVSNTAGLTKNGRGTLVLNGAGPNTYGSISANGNTTVNAGTVQLSKTAGVTAVANGTLLVNPGGTLLLGASDQIADTVALSLAGGAFQVAGFNEQLGTLNLAANSLLDFGSGSSVLQFADSIGVAWTGGTILTVTNWNGSVSGGGPGRLLFGSSDSALTAGQVSQIQFANPPGFPAGNYPAMILSTGEVVPFAASPVITSQPADRIAIVGDNVSLSVAATGTPAPAYQWTFNSTNLPAATGSTLLLPGITTDQAGPYFVVVSNIAGTTNSRSALVTVYVRPTLSGAAYMNGSQFQLSLTGLPGYTYVVQASTNLTDWTPLETNTSPFSFCDTNAGGFPFRFYRGQYLP